MTAAPAIRMINAHAEGELGYVAIDGVPEIPGRTIADRLDWLNSDAGIPLRRHLMLAPRANPACSVNLLVDPVDPAAAAAFVILQPNAAHASSGSNSICVTTALLESAHDVARRCALAPPRDPSLHAKRRDVLAGKRALA